MRIIYNIFYQLYLLIWLYLYFNLIKMLNLLKKKQTTIHKYLNKNINLNMNNKPIEFSPSWKEWKNSIYSYNKEYIKSLVYKDKLVNYLFKSYFNLTRKKLNVKRFRFNRKRFSANRLFLSEAEIKHTNNNVNITLFLFNKNKNFTKSSLKRSQVRYNKLRKYTFNALNNKYKKIFVFNVKKFTNKLYWLMTIIFKVMKYKVILRITTLLNLSKYDKLSILQYKKLLEVIKKNAILEKKEFFWTSFFKDYLKKKNRFKTKILKRKFLAKNLKIKVNNLINSDIGINNNNINNTLLYNQNQYVTRRIKRKVKKNLIKLLNIYKNLYYYQTLLFNKNRFTNWFLNFRGFGIINIISKIYNKKVEFNIVNLKSMHLNSDIYSKAIALKLRNRNNKLLRILKKALLRIKLPRLFDLYSNDNINKNITRKKDLLNNIKYKLISGVRFEASGRLTRRLIASRAIFKFRYVGSLKNIYSSYVGLSSVMLRGYLKSNIEYTLINSKTRNGAFGLKGWSGSY